MAAQELFTPEEPQAPSAPLNRKYRPQSFDSAELVGQDHIVRTLKNAIRHNRLAQAYLFCGPRGTGKTSTARILAKAANCLDPDPDKRPCNVCTACVAINSGSATDVIEIDAASNRGIDDIRDLRERVNYAPTQLREKFYIIDEAHQITGAAANAFLKTLEEPPAHARFVLATTDPEALPSTIVSRCQRFDFRRHTPANIAGRVRVLAGREGIRLSEDAIALVADLAHGSMRDPVGLLDQLSNYQTDSGSDEISVDDVRNLVGLSGHEAADQILTAMADRDAVVALRTIAAAIAAGQDPRQLNRQIVSLIRDALYQASGVDLPTASEALKYLAGKRPLAELIEIATCFTDTESDIRSAVIPQLPLEIAVLQAILETRTGSAPAISPQPSQTAVQAPSRSAERRPPPDVDVAASAPAAPGSRLQDRVRGRENPPASEPAPVQAATAPPPVQSTARRGTAEPDPVVQGFAATIEALRDQWSQIRADVKTLDRRTEALLMEADPFAIEDGQVILASPYDFHRNKLNDPERRAILETVIHRRFGVRLRVNTELRAELLEMQSSKAQATPDVRSTTAVQMTEAVEDVDEKYLNAVVRTFEGEILDDPVP